MRAAVLYASNFGRTKKVVAEVIAHLVIRPDVFDVKDRPDRHALGKYDLLAFFSPTYGDEELPEEMENFLDGFDLDLTGKSFVVCELGNYYGYDDFSFGPMALIRRRLLALHGTELCEPLSLDSFPNTAWEHLLRWVEHLNRKLERHVGS
jgi:flavodoxin